MRSPVESVELAPQPGLDELNQLIDEARSLGAAVRFNVSGNVSQLPDDVELVAYRVTQEALTNARRHAPGAPIDVTLDYGAGDLRLTVRDHGSGAGAPSPDTSGFGLIGMRERVAAVGGTLVHRDHPDGGFEVAACIPTRDAS
jgi:signal transduction histidine kinase